MHYHVLRGLSGGYMPADNQVFECLQAAMDYAQEQVNFFYDGEYEADDANEKGIEARREAAIEHLHMYCKAAIGQYQQVEVTACYEAECLQEE